MSTSIEKKQNNGSIRDMKLFIKRWWLLEKLRKEIKIHSSFQPVEDLASGKAVLLSSQFFLANDPSKKHPEHPGLVYKSVFGKLKKGNEKKLKRRIQEYNDIFEVCVKEGYIEMIKTVKGAMPSTATPKAHSISGWFGLLQGILSKYSYVWIIIWTLIITIIGSAFGKKLLDFIVNKIKL